jgi:hypothetical protein
MPDRRPRWRHPEPPIVDAYAIMAERCRYRPGAVSDGYGNLDPSTPAEVTPDEVREYARRYYGEEHELSFMIGVPDYLNITTMILAIEAARLCCGGPNRDRIEALLREAIAALPERTPANARD